MIAAALARRSLRDPEAIAYWFACARSGTTLPELAAAAGLRWTIKACFLRAKDDLGLNHCDARAWHGWHRHIRLVMAAAAFLASPLTTSEIRYVLTRLLPRSVMTANFIWAWSLWRRHHQNPAAIAQRKMRSRLQLLFW